MERWSIKVDKDYLKFSAAHFLIFPDGSAERLHGHNYKVFFEIESDVDEHGLVLDFKRIKPLIKKLVDEVDEHFLVPGRHPVLRVERHADGQTEILYRERRYLLPSEDVIVLPISNSSAENLATWLGRELLARVHAAFPSLRVDRLTIGVEETKGQRGVFHYLRD